MNILLNLTLIWWLRAAGLALATALCSYLQVILLLGGLGRRLERAALMQDMAKVLGKTLVATAVMTAVALALMGIMQSLPVGRDSRPYVYWWSCRHGVGVSGRGSMDGDGTGDVNIGTWPQTYGWLKQGPLCSKYR